MLIRTTITRAVRVLLATAALPLAFCSALGEDPGPSIAFRIGSSVPASGLIELRLSGRESSVFTPEHNVIDRDHVDRISFFQDRQGRTAIGLTFTDEGFRKLEAAASAIEPAAPPSDLGPPNTPHRRTVILIDGEVIAAPTLWGAVPKDASIIGLEDDSLLKMFKAVVLNRKPLEK